MSVFFSIRITIEFQTRNDKLNKSWKTLFFFIFRPKTNGFYLVQKLEFQQTINFETQNENNVVQSLAQN